MAPVFTYGLKFCVIVGSGELSITSVGSELLAPDDFEALGLDALDEHAAIPAARSPAAATAVSRLYLGTLNTIL